MFLSNDMEMRVGPPPSDKPLRLGVQSFLGGLFLVMLVATGFSLTLVGYRIVSRGVERSALHRSNAITRAIARELELSVHAPIESFISQAARGPLGQADTLEKRLERLPLLLQVFRSNYFAKGVILGFENGDFFLALFIESETERMRYGAPPESVMVVIDCRGPIRLSRARELFFDINLNLKAERPCAIFDDIDPRTRDWYKMAMESGGHLETGPYFFRYIQRQGIIISEKSPSGKSVVGMLLDLQRVSDILKSERPTNGSQVALFFENGSPVAESRNPATEVTRTEKAWDTNGFPPVIQKAMAMYVDGKRGANLGVYVDGIEWLVSLEELEQFSFMKYVLAVAIPRDELFAEAKHYLSDNLIGLLGLLLLTATAMWFVARNIGRPLQSLAAQANRPTPTSENEIRPSVKTGVAEIRALASGMDSLHGEHRKFLRLLSSIGAEMDISLLLDQVIREIVGMVDVYGGVLVLCDGKKEVPTDVRVFWHDAEQVEKASIPARNKLPRLTLYKALELGMTLQSTVTRDDPRAILEPLKHIFADASVIHADIICVPLSDRGGSRLGAFTLIKRVTEGQENSVSFPPELKEFCETLAGAIGIVLETRTLINGQHDLRDALIHILAGAIDAKSPYTGGHCARVPYIFHQLLQAAHETKDGALKGFCLDKNGWESARLAAWLHDCGKVTTPEYVVDKATKLETLYNRIHEIRTRFEVLKRDAEISCLRAIIAGADEKLERRKMEESLHSLDDEFAFVAACNIGGENLDEDDASRLAAIGRRTWTRTLDKRLGVSREELARMNQALVEPVPARDRLLADLPEHIIPRGNKDRLPADNKWGFKLQTPEALYNRGELYNLLITRGTLTKEERYKINDHITQTIIMLEKLPLPKELAQVPEIAGVHHERMDGKGYPRGLTRDEMSLPGRMLAIADIFEALTASDRPYKASKKLSEALQIMEEMKDNGHIDPDLYELFINAGIPQRYAKEFLASEQNDMDACQLYAGSAVGC